MGDFMLKRFWQSLRKPFPVENFFPPDGSTVPTMREPTNLPSSNPPGADYPVDCLSPKLREVVGAIARLTQAPSAIAAQSALAVVSLSFAGRTKVETLGSSKNAASFFVLIAASGERKSAADELAMEGVNRTVMEMRTEHERALAAHEAIVASLERGSERPSPPVYPNFLVTEPTVEGAFKAIESGAGFLGWFTDEATAFWGGHSMSKEKLALTAGILSKLWDGSFFFRPRATQTGDGYVPPTATTMNLMFQPILIPATYGSEFLVGQGLLARMLPAWPESKMGERFYRDADARDHATVQAFQDETAAAIRETLSDPTNRTLGLSEGARTVCIKFHDQVEGILGPGKWASEISGFAAKAPEHACRIAALMTLFETPDADAIEPDTMLNACEIVEYHLLQYKHLCAAAKNDTIVSDAQKLLDWLVENAGPGSGFATDKILQTGPLATRNAKKLEQALGVLIEYDWVSKLPEGTVIEGKKRRKAYRLNPKVHAASRDKSGPERAVEPPADLCAAARAG
ncbi:MAG: YfjI family protein [Rhodobacteraceae bacterium]|nr:YfjI family protein [Paracoccaceae bacterium]